MEELQAEQCHLDEKNSEATRRCQIETNKFGAGLRSLSAYYAQEAIV